MVMPNRAVTGGVLWLLTGFFPLLLTGCSSLMDSQVPGDHLPVISNLSLSPATVHTGGEISKSFSYNDAGGDIESCITRDDMSGARTELAATGTDADGNTVYNFPGTNGVAQSHFDFEGAQAGVHHYTMWCVDLQGSLSNTLEATVTMVN